MWHASVKYRIPNLVIRDHQLLTGILLPLLDTLLAIIPLVCSFIRDRLYHGNHFVCVFFYSWQNITVCSQFRIKLCQIYLAFSRHMSFVCSLERRSFRDLCIKRLSSYKSEVGAEPWFLSKHQDRWRISNQKHLYWTTWSNIRITVVQYMSPVTENTFLYFVEKITNALTLFPACTQSL